MIKHAVNDDYAVQRSGHVTVTRTMLPRVKSLKCIETTLMNAMT